MPQLKASVPNQPSEEEFDEEPRLHRLVRVFDRAGYSPDFRVRMKAQHIACQTYHKYPGEDGPVEAFFPRELNLASGQVVEMTLAARGWREKSG